MLDKKNMLVVIDTNIFVSALLKTTGNPTEIVSNIFNGNLVLALSEQQIRELKNTLSYSKIRKLIKLTDEGIAEYIVKIELIGRVIDIDSIELSIESRDQEDNYLLKTLIASNAKYLITGDKDLLVLQEYYSKIITPAEFVNRHIAR